MIHYEQVSFDKEESWFWLVEREEYKSNKAPGCFLGCSILALVVTGGGVSEFGVTAVIVSFVAVILAGSIYYLFEKEGADERKRDENFGWHETNLKILDVQRVDTKVSSSQTGVSGVGIDLGYGLMVGGGGGHTTGKTITVIGWQFYTNIGVMVVPDDAYASWLQAGKPKTCIHSLKDSNDERCQNVEGASD